MLAFTLLAVSASADNTIVDGVAEGIFQTIRWNNFTDGLKTFSILTMILALVREIITNILGA